MESVNDPDYKQFFESKRVAGVEPLLRTSLPGVPPAHDTQYPDDFTLAAAAITQHFKLCFFCHIGDRYTSDHFCEEGRDLLIAMFDEGEDPWA